MKTKLFPQRSRLFLPLLAVVVLLSTFEKSDAGVIPGVTINAVSSEYFSGNTDQRHATNLVTGAGLFGLSHSSDAKGSMWLTLNSTAAELTNAFVTFDLGAVHTINKMNVWNYNEVLSGANILTRRGVKTANISVAGKDLVFTTNIVGQTFARASGTFSSAHDTVDMGGISARYVRINVLTNYFEASDFRVGLSEVQFIDNTVAPTALSASQNFLGNRVTVRFSEPVLRSTATNLTNYVVQSGAITSTVFSATMNDFDDSVILQTSTLDSNLVYTVSAQNVRDAANIISIASTQLTVDRELVLWLKADENVTADGSGFVSEWDDRSGFANNAAQLGGGIQPTLVSGVINGKPAVHFDGVSQQMEVPHSASLVADRDFTIFTVLSIDTQTGGKSPVSKVNLNIPSSFDYQIVATTGKPSLVRGNGSGFTTFGGSTAGLNTNQFYIASAVMRGTNAIHYLNGNFNGSGFIGAPLGDSGSPIRLGMRADAATKFTGNLAEVIILRGAASDDDQIAINNYLGQKYGISVVALAITSQPESATRLVGQKATFGVSAVAGTPTILYQWQKGVSNITGATNATYTTPTLTLIDDASTYRVVVSTPLGITTNSASATLTVLPDTQAPTIYSATRSAGNSTGITVNFSEAVNPASATNILNYSLNNGVSISSAAMGSSLNIVILTTTGLTTNTTYRLTVQNVQDMFSNGMTLSSAQILPANAVFWIRADSGIFTNASGFISQTDDQSINQNNAVQYRELGRKPAFVPNAMNSNPVMRFNGVSNFLEAASSPSLAITGDMTIYAVANFTDFVAAQEIISKTAGNQPASFDYYVQFSPLVTRLYRGNGIASATITGTAPSAGVPHVMTAVMQQTNVSHFLDGASVGTGVLTNALADTGAPLRVGSRNDLFQFMKGDIAEILVFNTALSAAERKSVDNYLGTKYFPFSITQQPANITQVEGQTATFTVAASAGSASFEYQWQKGISNIPGATNASYTTPVLTQGDNNSSFRVVITLPNGATVNSDAAILTVLPDQEAPTVTHSGKKLWSLTQIVVVFSESVDPATATNINNYSLDNGAIVTAAVIGNSPNEVILTVSGLTNGVDYVLTTQNVRDLFNNMMTQTLTQVGFYPANLALWLNADTNITFDAQNLVGSWGDLSGNANDAFELGGSPLFVPNAINGHSVVRFDGTNQYLVVNPSDSIALTGDITIIVAAKFRDFVSTANEIGILGKSSGNQAAPYDFYLLKNSGLPRFYRGNGTTSGSLTGTIAPSAGSVHALTVQMSGTSASMFLDGQANGVGTITAAAGDTGSALGIGTREDLRPKMNGDIAEILMFGEALSAANRQEIENYLSAKYGIVSSPVVLSIQSSNGNVVVSWPVPTVSFNLESTANLSAPNWQTVTNAIESSGGTNRVTIAPNGNEQYYRLRNP